MNYAKKIKQYREKELLTQRQLAEKLKVGVVNVSRWERGHYKPTLETKRKLKLLFEEAGIAED